MGGELVSHDIFISEAALWTSWTHRGVLQAKCDSIILALDAEHFSKVVNVNFDARAESIMYAKGFLQGLNREPEWKLNDLYCSSLIEGLWFRLLNDFQITRRTTMVSSRRASTEVDNFFRFRLSVLWLQFKTRCSRCFCFRRASDEDGSDEDSEASE
eukprot:SRR837773.24078.p1 GENE.SRR837773.24078~~SRR837773.24078.p1  ORF type:complete len:170 (-),score=57.65 SRR837773.24078:107-577(-)